MGSFGLIVLACAASVLSASPEEAAEPSDEDRPMLLPVPNVEPLSEEMPPPDPVFERAIPPTAEEELRDAGTLGFTITGDLRLDGMVYKDGGSMGARALVEGERLGIEGGITGLFLRSPDTLRWSRRGVLDALISYSPLSGPLGRVRLEAGLGALFSQCLNAAGPDLGLSGEMRFASQFAVVGAVRTVLWPYRSLDWHLAAQVTLAEYQIRLGFRQVSLDDRGLVDGVRHTQGFLGPWIGMGIRM